MAKLREKQKIAAIIERLEKSKFVNPDGKISYKDEGWFFADMLDAVDTSVLYSPPVPESVRRRFITAALFSPGAAKPLTPKLLLKEINAQLASYVRTTPAKFFLATSISISPTVKLSRAKILEGGITFPSRLPRSFDRRPLESTFRQVSHDPNPKGYTAVIVSVKARSVEEAYETGINELDYFRGIWNFANNYGAKEFFSSGIRRPINRFCLGQVRTIHDAAGKLAVDSHWYSTDYIYLNPTVAMPNWATARRNQKQIRRWIRNSPYRDELQLVFIRYARALDTVDYESAFINLWSLLEFLTNCRDGKYDSMIKRCLFLFDDVDLHREILEHLRWRRNSVVHTATADSGKAKSLLYQLKHYVEKLISFHLHYGREFGSREEAAEFLDLPHDPVVMRTRIKRFKLALKIAGVPSRRRPSQPSKTP